MRAAILGAGVIGITTAWYLREQGWDVDVYDRQRKAGMETSFANGGQISVSHAEPWAAPGVPLKALKWLGQPDAPLLYRIRADPDLWRWSLRFLRECTQDRWLVNTKNLISLGLYSRAALQDLRLALPLEYEQSINGIMHVYTDTNIFEAAKAHASTMESFGIDRQVLTAQEAFELEPALASLRTRIEGATYTRSDEHGDALMFTRQLAEHCKAAGVKFHYNVKLSKSKHDGKSIAGITAHDNLGSPLHISADAYVIALGAYSKKFAYNLGVDCPIYPAKGYSATYDIEDPSRIPRMSITDEERKIVFSKMGNRLRVAGTAEFNGFNTDWNAARCRALDRATEDWFPESVDLQSVRYWAGLRPATPNNTPMIGLAQPYDNLYWNTGHGTLGWTHSCGSAKGLAQIMSGANPDCDFSWLR